MDRGKRNDGAMAPDERVRFCLRCGAVVDFTQRTCPACGHVEPLQGVEAEVSCPGCERSHAASLQFCPACGREVDGAWPAVATVPVHEAPPAGGLLAFSVLLAWLAPLAAMLALALALRAA
jgi:RNA polymerase subunit RPABC4/transcription elongation factor Spt4